MVETDLKPEAKHLAAAIKKEDDDMVEWLLNSDPPAPTTPEDSTTPHILVVRAGSLRMVKGILKAGIDVETKDFRGISALQYAIRLGHNEIVHFLVNEGKASTENCGPYLHGAFTRGQHEIVDYLLGSGISTSSIKTGPNSALVHAVRNCDENLVRVLLKNKANPNEKERAGTHVLLNAIKKHKPENAQILVEFGAEMAFNDIQLRLIVRQGNFKYYQSACKAHNACVPDEQKEDHQKWFFEALTFQGRKDYMVKEFLELGVDVNGADEQGMNAISKVIDAETMRMVPILVNNNSARMKIPSDSISRFIVQKKKAYILTLIQAPCKETEKGIVALNEALNCAIVSKSFDETERDSLVDVLLSKGANAEYLPDKGFPPFFCAAERGSIKMVMKLLERGAYVNFQARNGFTALIQAAKHGHLPIVRLLLQKGANPQQRTNNCESASCHVFANTPNSSEIMELLGDAEESNKYDNVDMSYFPIAALVEYNEETWTGFMMKCELPSLLQVQGTARWLITCWVAEKK